MPTPCIPSPHPPYSLHYTTPLKPCTQLFLSAAPFPLGPLFPYVYIPIPQRVPYAMSGTDLGYTAPLRRALTLGALRSLNGSAGSCPRASAMHVPDASRSRCLSLCLCVCARATDAEWAGPGGRGAEARVRGREGRGSHAGRALP
eukprot:3709922-Rhodomonas_salina.1